MGNSHHRTPAHPYDALTLAADRALLISETGVHGPRKAHVLDWLGMFGREADELARQIERTEPDEPFDGERDLHATQAVARALWALNASVGDMAEEEEWRLNADAAVYLCGELGRLSDRMREAAKANSSEGQAINKIIRDSQDREGDNG